MALDKPSFLGLDNNYVQDDRTVITVGAPNYASATAPDNLKLRNPKKKCRIFSVDPTLTFIEFDMSAINDERLDVGGFVLINHNLKGKSVGAGPLFEKTPYGSYTLKFNRTKIYHRLFPEAILASSNLNGTVSRVQEYPANKITADWLTATNPLVNTSVRFSFVNGIPALTVGPQHKFYVLVRKTNSSGANPSARLTLYNNGVAVAAQTTTVITSTAGQIVTLFSVGAITGFPTDNIELLVEGLATANGTIEIGAVLFMPIHPVDTSVSAVIPLPSYQYRTHLYIHHFIENALDGTKYVLFEANAGDPGLTYLEFGTAIISKRISGPNQIDWGSGGVSLIPPTAESQTPMQAISGAEYFRSQGSVRRRKLNVLLDDVLKDQAIRDFWGYLLAKQNISGAFYFCIDPTTTFINEDSIYGRITEPIDMQPKRADQGQVAYPLNLNIIEVIG